MTPFSFAWLVDATRRVRALQRASPSAGVRGAFPGFTLGHLCPSVAVHTAFALALAAGSELRRVLIRRFYPMINLSDLPTIDLSIVTFNSQRWLDGFWRSLMQQSFPLHKISLLIRDNGSEDGTVAAIREMLAEHQHRFASASLECGQNIGFGRGHNANLARGSAVFCLVSNVDLTFDERAIEIAVRTAMLDAENVAAWEFRQKPYEHPKNYDAVTLVVGWASSACILFRRSAFEKIGGYEPRLFLYGEDVEISYRLRDFGFILRYCVNAVCWHYSYETANEIKPAQFFGSTLANVLLRLRYGTMREIFAGLVMYLGLLMIPVPVPGRLKGLLAGWRKLLRDGLYFLRTRKKSAIRFSFSGWDYDLSREGQFIEAGPLPADLPLVSIVVRTYAGRLGKLKEAVQSVQNQTYPNVELVVVEDGSNTAQAFIDSVAKSGLIAAVQYRSLPKGGRCLAGNAGLAAAKGVYACFLDDDDLLYADHVELLAGRLTERHDLAAVYSLAFEIETEVISHDPWEYQEVNRFVAYRERFSRPAIWHHNFIPIQAILFRRELFTRYGGFNVELERLEDWDLWVRYCQKDDYELIEKVTSAYRVPARHGHATTRQQELDDYYQKALRARDNLIIETTPNQVYSYAAEIAKMMYPVAVSRSRLLRIARRIPGIWTLRRVYLVVRGTAARVKRKVTTGRAR
ncbi:glycosyltransferase [Paraburkholderia denitrificans]|uniref:Glycosyltransferase n=1 Tax=Paraburkholderia denitrificans TaxID=694025 RepID=A0ABW0JAQ5_9BURK